jgi:hypothetical protein
VRNLGETPHIPREAPPPAAHESRVLTSESNDASGGSAGSVGAQRARLPQAIACNDPVAGVWRAHTYSPRRGSWAMFTLHIERAPHGVLSGTIVSHEWGGGSNDSRPPPCSLSDFDITARMPAHGSIFHDDVDFAGGPAHMQINCATGGRNDYNPDHFTGHLDAARQEFQSVNNDGGWAVNEPHVFRRIDCLPGDPPTPE